MTGRPVVTIEGAWGSGKTTFMKMVERGLAPLAAAAIAPRPCLTLRQAARGGGTSLRTAERRGEGGVVTAWFNPWAYQSGEQVWAGLTSAVIAAAAAVLHPDDKTRERYWFSRNWAQLNKYALRRTLGGGRSRRYSASRL